MRRFVFTIVFCLLAAAAAYAQSGKGKDGLSLKYMVHTPRQHAGNSPMVVLLHGYGSNERDLFELRSFLPKEYIVIAPRAPYQIAPDGYQWFESEIVDGMYSGKQEHLTNSSKLIMKFIAEVVEEHGGDPRQVYVAGFSQGAMMSYYVGLTAPDKIKGIGVLSGIMPASLKPMIKASPALNKLRIFVAHGTADDRLPYVYGKEASDYLKTIGLKPEFHSYEGMRHRIAPAVMKDFVSWLERH